MKYFLILLFVSIICEPSAEESENDIASENSEQILSQSGSLIESANAPIEPVEDDEQCVASGELTVLQKVIFFGDKNSQNFVKTQELITISVQVQVQKQSENEL